MNSAIQDSTKDHLEESMAGCRLFSPSTIAAYTVICNLPLGWILYGQNLRARWQALVGAVFFRLGIISLALILLRDMFPASSVRPLSGLALQLSRVLTIQGAIAIYQIEKGPFARDLLRCAVRGRWWASAFRVVGGLGFAARGGLDWNMRSSDFTPLMQRARPFPAQQPSGPAHKGDILQNNEVPTDDGSALVFHKDLK